MWIQTAARRGHELHGNAALRLWVLLVQASDVRLHAILQLGRRRSEVGSAGRRSVVTGPGCRRTRLKIGGIGENLANQVRADDLAAFVFG